VAVHAVAVVEVLAWAAVAAEFVRAVVLFEAEVVVRSVAETLDRSEGAARSFGAAITPGRFVEPIMCSAGR
jgi:hypothetical protein